MNEFKKEIWKPIIINGIDYTGIYEVSNKARIKSLASVITRKDGIKMNNKVRFLTPSMSSSGYLSVKLRKDGKVKNYLFHRIIANAFIKELSIVDVVHHKINRFENLPHQLIVTTARHNSSIEKTINSKLPVGVRKSSTKKGFYESLIYLFSKSIYLGRYDKVYNAAEIYNLVIGNYEQGNLTSIEDVNKLVDNYRKNNKISKIKRFYSKNGDDKYILFHCVNGRYRQLSKVITKKEIQQCKNYWSEIKQNELQVLKII